MEEEEEGEERKERKTRTEGPNGTVKFNCYMKEKS